jgi:hypothetical protein
MDGERESARDGLSRAPERSQHRMRFFRRGKEAGL